MSGESGPASDLRAARDALYQRHIMEVAEKVFAENGYATTKVRDIASAAGVSLTTLYQSWSGKEQLYRAILISRDRELMEAVVGRMQGGIGSNPSVALILWIMEASLTYFLSHPDYLRLILQEGLAWYHNAAQPTDDEQALWDKGLEMMSAMFRTGTQMGELVAGKPEDQSRLMMSLQQTRLANWVADGMREEHEVVIRRIQTDFIRLFCTPDTAGARLNQDGTGLSATTLSELEALNRKVTA